MRRDSVLIIGAGMAGLAAAGVLVEAGVPITLVEARERFGGRMCTLNGEPEAPPIELGAEFIHGERLSSWQFIRAAALPVHAVPDKHWRFANGKLSLEEEFWGELSALLSRAGDGGRDQDVQSFLDQASGASPAARKMVRAFVEGFHAAHADRMGTRALARAEAASERDHADRLFRVTPGYSSLVDWFVQRLSSAQSSIHLNTVVQTIRWRPGRVEALAQTTVGPRRFEATRAIVTLPLGVLQATGPGAVRFEPELVEKQPAIQGLAMGHVVKVVLQFRLRFWPQDNFGFIHAQDEALPTWWSDERGPVLTAWTGGPGAERLEGEPEEDLVNSAVKLAAQLFGAEVQRTKELLVAARWHDWSRDPFSRGAYSYTPVGMIDMPERLAAPVAETLFFAGEATDANGEQGTVHAALDSGRRAAQEVLSPKEASWSTAAFT